jgi:hypothetical protein
VRAMPSTAVARRTGLRRHACLVPMTHGQSRAPWASRPPGTRGGRRAAVCGCHGSADADRAHILGSDPADHRWRLSVTIGYAWNLNEADRRTRDQDIAAGVCLGRVLFGDSRRHTDVIRSRREPLGHDSDPRWAARMSRAHGAQFERPPEGYPNRRRRARAPDGQQLSRGRRSWRMGRIVSAATKRHDRCRDLPDESRSRGHGVTSSYGAARAVSPFPGQ